MFNQLCYDDVVITVCFPVVMKLKVHVYQSGSWFTPCRWKEECQSITEKFECKISDLRSEVSHLKKRNDELMSLLRESQAKTLEVSVLCSLAPLNNNILNAPLGLFVPNFVHLVLIIVLIILPNRHPSWYISGWSPYLYWGYKVNSQRSTLLNIRYSSLLNIIWINDSSWFWLKFRGYTFLGTFELLW